KFLLDVVRLVGGHACWRDGKLRAAAVGNAEEEWSLVGVSARCRQWCEHRAARSHSGTERVLTHLAGVEHQENRWDSLRFAMLPDALLVSDRARTSGRKP